MSDVSEAMGLKQEYHSSVRRKILFIVLCVAIAIVSLSVSVTVDNRDIGSLDVYRMIWDHISGVTYPPGSDEWIDDFIIWRVRLPRTLFAAVGGAGLSIAGVAMQSVMKNPLADPYTTGVSSGACFGVAMAMVMGFSISGQMDQMGFFLNAFVFALIPMALIITLSPLSNSSPATLILAGVAISYLFNSLNTLLMVTADAETLAGVYRWQIGSLTDVNWTNLYIMSVFTISGITVISALSKKLNIMSLGDAQAKSLGLDVNVMRIACLLIMSLMVASIVAFVGIIGFIGLVAPHIVRMVIGSNNRYVIPAAAMFGAVFLMVADIVSRAIATASVPVGVVVSFVGAPIFLYLMVKQRRSMW